MANAISIFNGVNEPPRERIEDILARGQFTRADITDLLSVSDTENLTRMYEEALKVTLRHVGNSVRLRGIIEFTNICAKNCFYCGIRRDDKIINRYFMDQEEIVKEAEWIENSGYGSMVLQSGEQSTPFFISFLESVIKDIKRKTSLGITLSVGEQSRDIYQRWFDAGAHRYLLRIETSNPDLYKTLHPHDHSFYHRLSCIDALRDVGYQVGTGVMIGLPGQTIHDLARDIMFYREGDIDMFGMGPYIMDERTPLATEEIITSWKTNRTRILRLSLNMIAITRLVMRDVNIAATTALEVLDPKGREKALDAGANVVMPVVTPTRFRESYQLYLGKPNIDQDARESRDALVKKITSTGRSVCWNEWGDSPHFSARTIGRAEKAAAETSTQ